jgi:hypothetical protein
MPSNIDITLPKHADAFDDVRAQLLIAKNEITALQAGGGVIPLFIFGENPAGFINGINTVFTTAHQFVLGTTALYWNGLRQNRGAGNDYVEGAVNTLTMAVAPVAGDVLVVDYIKV